ncbi:DUF1127 domain-containing protein [Roseovarius sp. C7]|uniref:DUF1127 domain-containing protein n=1 Tax=Roseovarius sp. C7 TaxID=3398643 RepID=UPI0039F6E7BD
MAIFTQRLVSLPDFAGALHRGLAALGDALTSIVEHNGRLRRMQWLQDMSDEELAERGLKREDIVRHVFGD